jgi:hypothetical protein
MKDINYFLDRERKFQKEHPNGLELYYDSECGCMMPKSYPEDFLQDGWMNKFALGPHSEEVKDAIRKYNLSEVEVLIMNCFYGNLSQYFRDDIYAQYGKVPEFTKEMQTVLESFIKKAPKHKEGMLYRFLNSHDTTDFKVGDVFVPSCSLTTTNEDWNQDKNVYVITPLPETTTSAYDIYKIYNHGEENQVNFLKGTKFRVSKIEDAPNGHRRIYLNEL